MPGYCGYFSSRFLSTPSARRATSVLAGERHMEVISIHALREEGDYVISGLSRLFFYFYPRPPRGGRRMQPARKSA